MPKQLIFSADARTAILRGVDKLAEAVKVTSVHAGGTSC